MPLLSIRIVWECFYLLIFYSEKFSTHVCRLPYAANVNLNLSISQDNGGDDDDDDGGGDDNREFNPLSPNSVQDQFSPYNYPYTVKR